eukprot:352751-Amphidinium_carterae.1
MELFKKAKLKTRPTSLRVEDGNIITCPGILRQHEKKRQSRKCVRVSVCSHKLWYKRLLRSSMKLSAHHWVVARPIS